jgi:SAM-dependent methyltransferase
VAALTGIRADTPFVTYETFAPYYDRFTADHGHDEWMSDIEALAREHGLRGRRLLDVGCGTGSSFMPMLRRGYRVTACDLSPAMVERARRKLGGRGQVVVADMRSLPWRGRFDLATCVDDAMNYLLSPADVVAALRSIRAALAPGGLIVFDVNSLATYRTGFAGELHLHTDGTSFRWLGEAAPDMPAGGIAAATIEVLDGDGAWTPVGRHVQRHHSIDELRLACEEAGLRCLELRGQVPGGGLVHGADEEGHTKIVCVAGRPSTAEG